MTHPRDTVRIEILRCPRHGVLAVALGDPIGGLRITPTKCCGSWETVKFWTVEKTALIRDLERSHVLPGTESPIVKTTDLQPPAQPPAHAEAEAAAHSLDAKAIDLLIAISEAPADWRDRIYARYYELTGASLYTPYRTRCPATRHSGAIIGMQRCVRDAHPEDDTHVY